MRAVLLALGIAMFLIGLLWVGQGTGYFPYPASSFMVGASPWSVRGLILAIAGAAVILLSRWVGRNRV